MASKCLRIKKYLLAWAKVAFWVNGIENWDDTLLKSKRFNLVYCRQKVGNNGVSI